MENEDTAISSSNSSGGGDIVALFYREHHRPHQPDQVGRLDERDGKNYVGDRGSQSSHNNQRQEERGNSNTNPSE